jgi:hypothetical protein
LSCRDDLRGIMVAEVFPARRGLLLEDVFGTFIFVEATRSGRFRVSVLCLSLCGFEAFVV